MNTDQWWNSKWDDSSQNGWEGQGHWTHNSLNMHDRASVVMDMKWMLLTTLKWNCRHAKAQIKKGCITRVTYWHALCTKWTHIRHHWLWPSPDILKTKLFKVHLLPSSGWGIYSAGTVRYNSNHKPAAHVNRQRLHKQLRIGFVNEYLHMYRKI